MPSFRYYLGKGLYEPCSPYREAYFFGAELNSVDADGWNCQPKIVDETSSFDLSTITKNHEVVVALLNISDIPEGVCNFRWEWYRNRDNKLLFSYDWSHSAKEGGWVYAYSYIGWVDWEINENGDYRVEVTVTGIISYKKIIQFTVIGIPEEKPPEPPPEPIGLPVIEALNNVSANFYSIYLEVLDWPYPFWLIALLFYEVSSLFSTIAYGFSSFFKWINEIAAKVTDILDWSTIWSYILSYVPNLEAIRDWFYDKVSQINAQILNWWSETSATVTGWIDAAKDWVQLWIDYLQAEINTLSSRINEAIALVPDISEIKAWFSNWWGNIAGNLESWWNGKLKGIDDLINSAFLIRDDFWRGWQELRDKVTEFFTDPEEWLYKAVDRIIERFW